MLVELTGADARLAAGRERSSLAAGSGPATARSRSAAPPPSGSALRPATALRLGQATLRVSAIIDKMPRGSGFAFAPPALVSEAGLAATGLIQPGSISTHLLPPACCPHGADPQAVGNAFQKRFPDGGWRATDRNDAGSGTRRFIDRLGQLLLMVALSALAIGGLGMSSAAAAFAASRRQSIAILKLVGAPRRTIHAHAADRARADRRAGDPRRAGGRRGGPGAGRQARRAACCRSRPTRARNGSRWARRPCSAC